MFYKPFEKKGEDTDELGEKLFNIDLICKKLLSDVVIETCSDPDIYYIRTTYTKVPLAYTIYLFNIKTKNTACKILDLQEFLITGAEKKLAYGLTQVVKGLVKLTNGRSNPSMLYLR